MELNITFEEVQRVGKLMEKDFSDPERSAIIQSDISCDVQACPGSGKTTAVVAKLAILAEKFRGTQKGICVLSHTNAAKDEIKNGLKISTSALFGYPNFIGTIQSFIDTYLAIPAYIMKFGHRPLMIEDEGYEYFANNQYFRLSYGTRYFLEQNRRRGAQNSHQIREYAQNYFAKLSYRFTNLNSIIFFDNNSEREFEASHEQQAYKDVFTVKDSITKLGYLTYHDAFSFANWYLEQFPQFVQALTKRFPFVVIDEMQDTDRYQLDLIDKIFLGRSVVQRFGDVNQSIYNHQSEGAECVWNPMQNFQITTSRRLSQSIARLSQPLGRSPQNIRGNPQLPNHNHTIICFSSDQAIQVIPVFGEIIEEEGLSMGPFWVVAAVAKPHSQNLTIHNYWPTFERRLNRHTSTSSYWEDLTLAHLTILQNKSLTVAKNHLLNAIIKILREQNSHIAGNRFYTSTTFEAAINKKGSYPKYQLNTILIQWVKQLLQAPTLPFQKFISDLQVILGLLDLQLSSAEIARIQQGQNQSNHPPVNTQNDHLTANFYRHSENIKIGINTIHAAKGQTHQATLLLETFYYQYDLHQLKPYLLNHPIQNPGARIRQRYLPLAYVACTRPTHLLCLAIQKQHLTDQEKSDLINLGWRIREL